jgi:hypothetical protein
VPYGFTGTSLSVTANTSYSAKQFICTIRGSNSNGTITRELSLNQNPPPTNTSRPLVLNMPTVASSSNVTLSCTPGTFNYSTSVSNEWWLGDGTFSAPTSRIGTGNSLTLGTANFTAWGGKYIFCNSIANGDGGSTTTSSYGALVPTFQRPVVYDRPNITGIPKDDYSLIGSIANCSGWTWSKPVLSESINWYISSSNQYSTGFINSDSVLLGKGTAFTLTKTFLESNKYKYLSCVVVGTNEGGSSYSYANYYISFWNLTAPTPTPTATPTPTPTATTTVVAPSQPAITSIASTTTTFTINWSAPTSNGGSPVTQYWAYVENTAGTTIAYCSTTGALSCTATGLTPSTNYKVIVSAWNSAGGVNRASGDQNSPRTSASTSAPVRATLPNPINLDFTPARYSSTNAPESLFSYVISSKSLGSSPCSNPCSGLVAGETLTLSRRIQTATNPGSVKFYVNNASRAQTDTLVASLTSGTHIDGIWTATWVVSQTITDNVWRVTTELAWGAEWASSGG